jgi:Protein of unknown function (DUF1353)
MPFLPVMGEDQVRLRVERVSDEEWMLLGPLRYEGNTDRWTVPIGFRTDFASVPRAAVWLVPRFGVYTYAAVLHDYFCRVGIHAGAISAVDADGVFRRVLGELGTPTFLRWLIWCGVRWSARTQEHRRAGWWRTAPQVLGLTLAALPIVGPPALVILAALRVYAAVEQLVGRREVSPVSPRGPVTLST